MSDVEDRRMFVAAFPSRCARRFAAAAKILPPAIDERTRTFAVRVEDETVEIPARIYNPEPSATALAELPATQAGIVRCLYTRHHDGFVRERHLWHVLQLDRPWSAPFVVALVGEYVRDR